MKTSVASVTFRRKSVCEVAELARRAGLDAVEWGGDIHVPPGNAQAARAALHCTRETGSPYPLMARITGQVQRRISVPCWKLRFHLDAV